MKYSKLARKLMLSIILITIISVLCSIIYYRSFGFLAFMYGAVLGGAVSIFKVILLERAVDKALSMDKASAGNYVSLQHLLRLGISAAALIAGAVIPSINLWGVVVGIIAYQISLYIVKFGDNSRKK